MNKSELYSLTPQEVVSELDKHIVGQVKAKRSVAIALRNRIRRQRLPKELGDEISPKNIIMIGSTGVGKTEIARRLSKLTGAPFIKVEATKYTEVGYVGRDVESMVRDLMLMAINMVRIEMQEEVNHEAREKAEERLLDVLLPGLRQQNESDVGDDVYRGSETWNKFLNKLRAGELDTREIEIQVKVPKTVGIEMSAGNPLEEMNFNFESLANMFGGKNKKTKKTSIKNAMEMLMQEEVDRLLDMDKVSEIAKERVETMGIIFIDEIDKVASSSRQGADAVSREGVQRDILPIVEGSRVNTKYGIVDTSHILFIAAGAFHMSKPSDLIPELQGRFPIRVELEELTKEDFVNILSKPQNALVKQYVELLKTEGVLLEFTDEGLQEIARLAQELNQRMENIGARRLHTIMELLLEEVSFNACDIAGQTVHITEAYVTEILDDIVKDEDMSRYIL